MLNQRPSLKDIVDARSRTESIVRNTPILTSEFFNELTGIELFFKCENFQKTGSFKIRGASNAIFSLTEKEGMQGVACQSSGNHGGAIACAAYLKNIHADIVMAKSVSKAKIHNVKTYKGNMIFCDSMSQRDDLFIKIVKENNRISIHPYDNYDVIAGQGTIALEILEQIPEFDSVVVPIGGGGLISGVSIALKDLSPSVKIIGCEPKNVDDTYQMYKANQRIDMSHRESVADGLMAIVGKLTLPIIQENVDDIILASEKEIIDTTRLVWERMKIIIEPSCALTLASVIKNKERFAGQKLVLLITGGNVDLVSLPWLKVGKE
jgi:threonine dehydratase